MTTQVRPRRQERRHVLFEENERLEREGFTVRRDVVWYPNESTARPCNPGGRFYAHHRYDNDSTTYYTIDENNRRSNLSGAPTSSAFEMTNVATLTANFTFDAIVLTGGHSAGAIEGKTSAGVRGFLASITEANAQVDYGTGILNRIAGLPADALGVLQSLIESVTSGFTLGGMKDILVPSESVGHIRVYQESSGWFQEGSDMNGRYTWVTGKNYMFYHVYTANYADYLTGKARWESFLSLPSHERQRLADSAARWAEEVYNQDRIRQPMRHPWLGWARAHNHPATSPPEDVRTLSSYARSERNYRY
jgi:hypothetical protein